MKIPLIFLTVAFLAVVSHAQETGKTGDASCPL
jgi:hypothetical protein